MGQAVLRLVLLAVLCGGFGTPFLKISSQRFGINASELLIINGFTSVLIGLLGFKIFNYQTSGIGSIGTLVAFATLLVLNIGFLCTNHSLSFDDGLVSSVYAIIPAGTFITVLIGLIFLKEAQQLNLWRFILGSLLMFVAITLVSSSVK